MWTADLSGQDGVNRNLRKAHKAGDMTATEIQEFVDDLWPRIDRTPEGATDAEDTRWVCGKDGDKLYYAKQLAKEKGIDLAEVIAGHQACCDCEIVFNLGEEE
jgi:hypothetical protein